MVGLALCLLAGKFLFDVPMRGSLLLIVLIVDALPAGRRWAWGC